MQDSGFESGGTAWQAAAGTRFDVSADAAHGGTHSAALAPTGTGAASISQRLDVAPFPEYVSGFYRLDRWDPAAGAGAVEFDVIVQGGGGAHTVRFVIGGLQATPANPGPGVAYVFLSRAAPQTGSWLYFGYPVARAFEQAFGAAPTSWSSIDLVISAQTGGGTAYFDDIYAGTQRDNPNRPAKD